MANKLVVSANITFSSGAFIVGTTAVSKTLVPTGADAIEGRKTLSTTAASLPLGDVGTIGFILIENLETTGTDAALVSVDGGSTFPFKALPGEPFIGRLNGGTSVQVKSSAGTPAIRYVISEA